MSAHIKGGNTFTSTFKRTLQGTLQISVSRPLIITVKTDNTGTSNNDQFTLPVVGTYDVDWGDGTSDVGLVGTQTHTFTGGAGTYQITIQPTITSVAFANLDDRLKMLSLDSWGTMKWDTCSEAFYGCQNMLIPATDVPNVSAVTVFFNMFNDLDSLVNLDLTGWDFSNAMDMSSFVRGCALLETIDITGIDSSNVTAMGSMFRFNQMLQDIIGIEDFDTSSSFNMVDMFRATGTSNIDISGFNISSLVIATDMMEASGLTVDSYNATLVAWGNQPHQLGVTWGADGRDYSTLAAKNARDILISSGWDIADGDAIGDAAVDFIITVQTDNSGTSNNDQFTLPAVGTYNVDWGDGTSDINLVGTQTHTFAGGAGTYQITIQHSITSIAFANSGDRLKMLSVDRWGDMAWTTCAAAFHGCQNMLIPATDAPDVSAVTDFSNMFNDLDSLVNLDLTGFDFSSAVNMAALCRGSLLLQTVDMTGIDTSNVTNTSNMFRFCQVITGIPGIENIDTSSVTDMNNMFRSVPISIDISGYDISSLVNASEMMINSAFEVTNYDLMLVAWEGKPHLNSTLFGAGNAEFSAGAPATARAALVSDLWVISDGGPV